MREHFKYIVVMISLLSAGRLAAQQGTMEEYMVADGKYMVVFAVVLVMLAVILGYLFFLDRKMKRMENEENKRS